MAIDMARFEMAPNGLIHVLKRAEAGKALKGVLDNQLQTEGPAYIPRGMELEAIQAARRAGLTVAILGPPGGGKTTLVEQMARTEELPLTTLVGFKEARRHVVIGGKDIIGDGLFVYSDGPLTMAVRADVPSLLYIDEAFTFPADVYTSIAPLLDHRSRLFLPETGERLSSTHLDIILTFNPPTIDERDRLPKPATLDRMVMIRFEPRKGEEVQKMLRMKNGLAEVPKRPRSLRRPMELKDALDKYGKALDAIMDELNSKTAIQHGSIIVKSAGERSYENTLTLICEGVPPILAVKMAMINPMAPLDDELVPMFLKAAGQLVESWIKS